jgi:hypothetical protein
VLAYSYLPQPGLALSKGCLLYVFVLCVLPARDHAAVSVGWPRFVDPRALMKAPNDPHKDKAAQAALNAQHAAGAEPAGGHLSAVVGGLRASSSMLHAVRYTVCS